MIRVIALSMLALGFAVTPAQVASEPDLNGLYVSRGVNPDGSEYKGFVLIAQRGESFFVSWLRLQGSTEIVVFETTSIGIGIISGGMLAVSYYSPETAGVVVYRIEENGSRLAGHWTGEGDGAVHVETLTKLPEPVSEPADASPPADQEPPKRRVPVPTAGTVSL